MAREIEQSYNSRLQNRFPEGQTEKVDFIGKARNSLEGARWGIGVTPRPMAFDGNWCGGNPGLLGKGENLPEKQKWQQSPMQFGKVI